MLRGPRTSKVGAGHARADTGVIGRQSYTVSTDLSPLPPHSTSSKRQKQISGFTEETRHHRRQTVDNVKRNKCLLAQFARRCNTTASVLVMPKTQSPRPEGISHIGEQNEEQCYSPRKSTLP